MNITGSDQELSYTNTARPRVLGREASCLQVRDSRLRHTRRHARYPLPSLALQRPFLARAPQANFHLHNILALTIQADRPVHRPRSITPPKCRPKSPTSSSSSRSAAARMPSVRLPPPLERNCRAAQAPLRGAVAALRLRKNQIGERWRRDTVTDSLVAARIKKNKKAGNIKFKVRCERFIYTLVLKDTDKAEKLKQSLPPGTPPPHDIALPARQD